MNNLKLAILICSYNRPEYLRQCLASVAEADLSQVSTVLIVDDCSSDKETIKLINDFELEGVELIKAFSKDNRSIKGSLLFGFDLLFKNSDVVMNLDGDATITKGAIPRMLELREKFYGHILTGFNCSTKNRDGSVRHKIIEQGDGWNKKYSVGGVNMMIESNTYLQIVRPALQKSIKENLNWDHQACIISNEGYGKPVVVLEPSCVQHIGFDSSMGHGAGGEPPDVASDFVVEYGAGILSMLTNPSVRYQGADIKTEDVRSWKKQMSKLGIPDRATSDKTWLLDITLIAVDDNIDAIIKAADISCRHIEFGAVKLLSSKDSDDSRAIKIRHLGSKKEYSQFVLKELAAYIETPYALIIQHDGYVINPEAWSYKFLEYDMVGAVWDFRDHKRTCNGGFSLRSQRMMDAIAADPSIYLQNDNHINNFAEDHVLFYIYRDYLEKEHGVRIAPEDVCNKFSIEAWGKADKSYKGSFGFHGYGLDFSKSDVEHKPY